MMLKQSLLLAPSLRRTTLLTWSTRHLSSSKPYQPSEYAAEQAQANRNPNPPQRPLEGVRVLELGNFVAGPYCSTILGFYGAEVIKVEQPGGDQVRHFRSVDENGTGWWWHSIGRNKKCIVLDLKTPGAQGVVRDLCKVSDVVVENFRPGKMESWGLGPEEVSALNPDLVFTRVSGYGQTGPYAARPGFASACEAMGGFRYVNGYPDRPSVRPNLSIGDTLAGIHAALGTVLALFARGRGAPGQTVDASIYESVFALMEGVLCEYDGAGMVRSPSGSTVTGIVPTGTYPCRDGKAVVIGANSDALFRRLMAAMGRTDVGEAAEYQGNQKRVAAQELLDGMIAEWTGSLGSEEVLGKLHDAQVPCGLIYSIEDIAQDEQYRARGMLEEVYVDSLSRTLKMPSISPKLSKTPGETLWSGPAVGEHTEAVLRDVLNYDQQRIDTLLEEGAVQFKSE